MEEDKGRKLSDHHIPTIAEIARIAEVADHTMRNLQITQCYFELSAVLAEKTGLGANWCTFATWASKQAGQTIRREDLARLLERRLRVRLSRMPDLSDLSAVMQYIGPSPDTEDFWETIWEIINPLAAFERASDAVARGNRKVFEEIGREFARFFASCLGDEHYDEEKIRQFCSGLPPGDTEDGRRHLTRAFTAYYRSLFESDEKIQAELLLFANISIGYHEQTRLQPEIAESMEAAFVDPKAFMRRLLRTRFPRGGWLVRLRLFLARLLSGPTHLDRAVGILLQLLRHEARLIITEHMMTIGLANGKLLRLGQDLGVNFPPSLVNITRAELRTLLEMVDPTPDSVRESGAVDWANLNDRLHFIVDFFRCYQEEKEMLLPPFSAEQVELLKAGKVPGGRL